MVQTLFVQQLSNVNESLNRFGLLFYILRACPSLFAHTSPTPSFLPANSPNSVFAAALTNRRADTGREKKEWITLDSLSAPWIIEAIQGYN